MSNDITDHEAFKLIVKLLSYYNITTNTITINYTNNEYDWKTLLYLCIKYKLIDIKFDCENLVEVLNTFGHTELKSSSLSRSIQFVGVNLSPLTDTLNI